LAGFLIFRKPVFLNKTKLGVKNVCTDPRAPRVLISDKMNKLAEDIFRKKGVEVDVKSGLTPDELRAIIKDYDGLAIRSSTTVTPEIIAAANGNLKVIGAPGLAWTTWTSRPRRRRA
jgi:hypothetical protein